MRARGGKSHVIRRMVTLLFFALAVCGSAKAALAQDWMLGSSISQRGSYNSNLLLNQNNPVSAFGSITIPELKLKRSGPTSSVTLDGQFKFAEYIDHSDLNSQDQNISLNASKDLSERSTLNFVGHFDHDSTLSSDRDIDGQFLNRQVKFISWDVAPSWTYQLSPIDQINWGGTYQQINYDDNTVKTDYRFYGTTLNYSHSLSEVAGMTGAVSYFRYQATDVLVDTSTDIFGALIGYRYAPTERFSISGAAGANYKLRHVDGRGDSGDVGYRVKFNTTYQVNDQTKAEVALSRDEEPSGEGQTVTRDRGTLTLSYLLSELTQLSLSATYSDNEQVADSGTEKNEGGKARFFSISPAVNWNITDQLSLGASYQFRYKIFASSDSAIDNGAFITLRYALQDMHWSGF